MRSRFLDSSDFRPRGGSGLAKTGRDGSLFWWTVLITLLLGLATFCWFFSIMVFKYPEKPFHYNLLNKLDRLAPITKFDPLKIPTGSFYGAKDLLGKYYNYNPEQLELANGLLKRSYIMNYGSESPVYVKGAYKVLFARPLVAGDVIAKGWVIRAQSTELEDVQVEVLLPGNDDAKAPYAAGDTISLDNKNHIACLMNVQRDDTSDGICATVVPITYIGYTTLEKKPIKLAPPDLLNMEAGLPVVADADLPKPAGDVKVSAVQTP